MLRHRTKLGFAMFIVLAASVSANALYLQSRRPGGETRTETITPPPPVKAATVNPVKPAAASQTPSAVASLGAKPVPPPAPKIEAKLPAAQPPRPPAVETIKAIQRELARRGYKVGADDGRVRIMMRESIIAYEFDRGLALSGEPSDKLLKELVFTPLTPGRRNDVQDAPPARYEASRAVVQRVQESLSALGYGPAAISGVMDDATRAALRTFQTERKLAVTGALSERLFVELFTVTGKTFASLE